MLVYMKHPQHGVHLAYTDDEIKACEANGWVRRDAQAVQPVPVVVAQAGGETITVIPKTAPEPEKRRGRPRKVRS